MSINSIRRRLETLARTVSGRGGGLDISKLTADQRARYQEWLRSDKRTSLEELLDRVGEGPQLDSDIASALWGPNWRINIDDTERSAADRYYRFIGR